MDDLISREEAYFTLTEYYHHRTETQHRALREALDSVPPVQPEPKWIPCEERLPELWSEVLTTWIVNCEYKITRAELRPHGWFALVFPDDGRYKQDGCIAWMPLPEPYAERRTDEPNIQTDR